jgi:hypothetical protein
MTIFRASRAAVLLLALGGCHDVLDLRDLDSVDEAEVWNNAALAEAYVNRVYYDNLPGWSDDEAGISDESPGGGSYMYGQLTESSVNYWPYEEIRRINILLAEIDGGTIDPGLKMRLKGEAYFFRAWRYWEMVKRFGGVPLILQPQNLTDDLQVTRTPTSQVVGQIVSDLDSAIALLPAIAAGSGGNDGHVHKGTAMAVKGRVLLYYASPQFNRTGDMARWQDAYAANLEARNYLASHGFGLHADFETLWFDEMNREAIFVRRYSSAFAGLTAAQGGRREQNGQETGGVHRWAAATRPLDESQGATGANRPTWAMVKAFPMQDGRPITGHAAYDSVYFWQNREPRFYATIAYNGAVWELSGKTGRRQWTYVGGESNNPTQSGFYTRKAVDPTHDSFQAFNGTTQWIEIRFAEVLLNLAEAANATGRTPEAYDQLIALRARAGIDPGTGLYGLDAGMSAAQMQDAIMLERRIELAYEAKRYWDLRRNMLFEELLNGTRRLGLTTSLIIPKAEWDQVRDTVDLESRYHEFFAQEVDTLDTAFDINWKPNYYFYAINPDHITLNKKLEQTLGWTNGTFDPLQ